MNIYKIRTDNCQHDQYLGFVVIADNINKAYELIQKKTSINDCTRDQKFENSKLIGTSKGGIARIVLDDFLNG